jgi:hypothetical protein
MKKNETVWDGTLRVGVGVVGLSLAMAGPKTP